ncbi:hypothetical protein OROGR_007351 [Orobanche gracilis]
MSDVPPEVIDQIFTRLPVKSLLRFRCVSKPFCNLIDSPDFIKSHLDRTLNSTSQRNVIVNSYSDLYALDFDSLDNPNLLNQPGKSQYVGTQVLGHSNGLLCLLANEDVFIWNPSTRMHKKLPVTEIEFPDTPGFTGCERIIYGFGYDCVNDDYKVVRIIHFFGEVENEVKVYSMKSDSWRRIEDFPYFLCYKHAHGVLVGGALHWAVTMDDDLDDPERWIASFDIATEEYHLIPRPEYVEMGFHMNVGEVGGKLTVHCNYDMMYMDIWVMNSYGVRESWTKLFSVAQTIDLPRFEYLRPFAYSKDGKKVLMEHLEQDGGKLLWYDLELKVLKGIRIANVPQFLEAFVCVQSLVKLTGGAKTLVASQEKKNKTKQKKTQQNS